MRLSLAGKRGAREKAAMRLEPTSRRFVSQRLKLHYADWGNSAAPPLVLLHGGRDHCRSLDWAARELARDYHVIAPDLRGHGDSDWSPDGEYPMHGFVYDLAQLIHQLNLAPATIVAHSLGGNIAIRYAGLYPENVKKLVAIEGLGPSPKLIAEWEKTPLADRMRAWIENKRAASARAPRRYKSLEDALARMKEANKFLSDEQARHLTEHGANCNEDGSWSWKFDPYVNIWPWLDIPQDERKNSGRRSLARRFWSMARTAGRLTRKRTDASGIFRPRASYRSRRRVIGCIMTSSRSSCARREIF
ncbi:MAG: alpha/beta hydrolase [Parvularculaceae bacterium]